MPPNVSMEKKVIDLLLQKLSEIGTPPANYRTTLNEPVSMGRPGDSIPLPAAGKISLYIDLSGVEVLAEATTVSRHGWRIRLSVWVAASSQETMLEGRADVIDVLHASEAAFSTIQNPSGEQPMWYEDFTVQSEMQAAGVFIGNQDLFYEYSTAHA